MIDSNVVDLAVEYLDQGDTEGAKCTLVDMHWYIDGRDKTIPFTEEVNEALKRRPSIFIRRDKGLVRFVSGSGDRSVSDTDMKLADAQYRKEFSAAYAKMRGGG